MNIRKLFILCFFATLSLNGYCYNLEVKTITSRRSFEQIQSAYSDSKNFSEKRRVYFADSSLGTLFKEKGIIIRIRTKKGKVQSTVKRRGLSKEQFAQFSEWNFKKHKYKCEKDKVIGKSVKLSCSLSKYFEKGKIKRVTDFLSKKQLKFLKTILEMDDQELEATLNKVELFGPINSKVYSYQIAEGLEEIDLVHWSLNGKSIYEISSKGSEKSSIEADFIELLNGRRVDFLDALTKSKWAYRLFLNGDE